MRCIGFKSVILSGLALTLMVATCHAEKASAPASDLEKALHPLAKHLDGLKSFYVDMTTSMTVTAGSKVQHDQSRVRMWRSLPDKFYIFAENNLHGLYLICDGKQVLVYLPKLNQYTLNPATPQSQAMLAAAGMGGGTSSYLLVPQMRAVFIESLQDKSARDLGSELINGVSYRRTMLSSPPNEDYIWVPETGPPFLARCISRQDFNGQVKLDNDTRFTWIADKPVADSTFVIQAPPGAKKVDSLNLASIMQGQAAGVPADAATSAPR